MSDSSSICRPGRIPFVLGLLLPALGVIGYIVQLSAHRLMAPWYMPLLGTLGVLCLLGALWQARTWPRLLALPPVLLVAGAEWAFLLGTRQADYTGPVEVGQPFPAFATLRDDGTPFTQRDLQGARDNVLVFFRGRW